MAARGLTTPRTPVRSVGPTTPHIRNSVPNTNRRRTPHNRSLSDGDHGSVGRGQRSGSTETTRPDHRRFRWTEELKEDLMLCWRDSSPARMGYMARMRDLWCEMHPEYSHFSRQHLRDQAANLRRQGYDLLLVPPRLSGRHSLRLSPQVEPPQSPQQLQQDHFRPEGAADEDFGTRKERVTGKFPLSAEQLAATNAALAEELPEGVDLLGLNWAVYHAALQVKPRTANKSSFEVKMRRRISQLQGKIEQARGQASRIQCVIDFIVSGRAFTPRIRRISADLRYHHHTLNKAILLVIKERFVERVRTLGKIKQSLEKRLRRVVDNAVFKSDPNRWFEPKVPPPKDMPTAEQVQAFWEDLYGQVPRLELETPALRLFAQFSAKHRREQGECLPVTQEEVQSALKGMKNHAAPGPDGINIFWWKKFTSVHRHLARIFTSFIDGAEPIPGWLVEGRTVLIPKKGDLSKPENYRPITCLNTLYKIFTKVLYERILHQINPVWRQIYEQRGAKRDLSGCKESLLIDRCVVQDAIQYKRNLSVAWIDYRKAFDSTSHQLVIHILKCLAVDDALVECLQHLMRLWRTRFTITAGGVRLVTGVVQYLRGIFQGDTLSALLFCISLMPLSVALRNLRGYMAGRPGQREHKVTHIFYMDDLKQFASSERELKLALDVVSTYSGGVGMSFGLDKCAVLHLRKGRLGDDAEDVELVDGSVIRHLDAEETYRYLGFAQRALQDADKVKEALRGEHRRRLRRIWRSDLSAKNKVAATNMFAVPVLLYSFGVVKWRRDELRQLDIDTRKMMHMHQSLHPRSSSPRLYVSREQGGRGLMGLECLHDRLVLGLASDVLNSSDPLLDFVHEHERHGVGAFLYRAADKAAEALGLEFRYGVYGHLPVDSVAMMTKTRRRDVIRVAEQNILLQSHVERPMQGVFFRHIEEQGLSTQLTFSFLNSAGLMSETEGFICACQDGVINTLVYRSRIMGLDVPDISCRACKQAPETLMHLLSACPAYAVSAYIHRHNSALRVLYYYLRHSYGIDRTPLLPYVPGEIESVVVNERCKIFWNFSFATIRQIQATKPDVVLFDFDDKIIYVIEFSAPAESNVSRKEEEKRLKYQPLLFELRQLHRGYAVKLVVLIIGTLGGMKESFVSNLASIPACRNRAAMLAGQMQKAVILGSLRLLRQHESGLQ